MTYNSLQVTNAPRAATLAVGKWRDSVKDLGVMWLVALTLLWLIGLGAVKVFTIIDGIFYPTV